MIHLSGMGNGEWGTGNGEWGTGDGERGTGDGGTGDEVSAYCALIFANARQNRHLAPANTAANQPL